MAYTTIKKPSDYFNTKLYTGNGGTQSITGIGFQPDWVWIKNRTSAEGHGIFDAVRGVTKMLSSANADAETTTATSLTAFGSDGFSVGSNLRVNQSSNNIVSWNWLANGAGAANTDGTISSTVSASTTSGFSIVSYSGNSTAGATIGHGLGVTPKMLIVRKRNTNENWLVYHSSTGNTGATLLNGTNAFFADDMWNNTSPTSSVFTVHGGDGANGSGGDYIAYCFAEKQGFSKFGSYTGNGSTDGTFVYTGFKPAFVINKIYSGTTSNWNIFDNKRDGFNDQNKQLYADLTNTEASGGKIDLLSNGFKLRSSSSEVNGSGYGYIYMAFAEQPLVGDNPATAR